jgi:hypothetical protein
MAHRRLLPTRQDGHMVLCYRETHSTGDGPKILCYRMALGIGLMILFAWLALDQRILLTHADGPWGKPSEIQHGPVIATGGEGELALGLAAELHEYLPSGLNCLTGWRLLSLSTPSQALCFTASDDGPYFSVVDLAHYSPPAPKPTHQITPPVWTEYPELLRDWPLDTHSYLTETITYLAEHEVHYGDRQSTFLALTFDCENETGATRRILETLRNENTHATFFLTGRYAYMWPPQRPLWRSPIQRRQSPGPSDQRFKCAFSASPMRDKTTPPECV